MYQSEQINELASALAKAQAEITPAIKDSTNPFFKSKYADLSSVWEACKTPLTKHGLSIIQTMDCRDGGMFLLTTLAHSSGQWIRSCMPINPTKNDAQGIGSAITYMRRYSLAAMVGVTTDEDDDGNAASMKSSDTKKEDFASPTTITNYMADSLQKMLIECSAEYQKHFWNFLKKEAPQVKTLSQLPVSMYERIRSGIKAAAEKEQSQEEAHV